MPKFTKLTPEQLKTKCNFIENYLKSQNAASGSLFDSNANVSNKNIATMEAELNKDINIQVNRTLVSRKIAQLFGQELAQEYIRQIEDHEIYVIADELVVVTDDGSYGRKALVTVPLKEYCESPEPPNEVIAIGPPIMMKFCAETTRPFGIHTMVSLNTIMIDGTGMCGGCRVTVGGETKFVCVDGPEFDGHKVDFDNMMMRMKAFRDREQEDNHKCRMELEKAGA